MEQTATAVRHKLRSMCLFNAVRESDLEKVSSLLEDKDNSCVDWGKFAILLNTACNQGNVEIAQLLVKNGVSVNACGSNNISPLHEAANNGSVPLVQFLAEAGADVNARDFWSKTPLIDSVQRSHSEVVKKLLKFGACINAKDMDGKTALHHSIWEANHSKIAIQVLLDFKADVDAKDNNGRTPVIYACEKGDRKTLQKLVELNADVNVRATSGPNLGETALHSCFNHYYSRQQRTSPRVYWIINLLDIVQLLIDAGAHVDVPNSKGASIVEFVRRPYFLGFRKAEGEGLDEETVRHKLLDSLLPLPLKCLAAKSCAKNWLSKPGVPRSLKTFISLHKPL